MKSNKFSCSSTKQHILMEIIHLNMKKKIQIDGTMLNWALQEGSSWIVKRKNLKYVAFKDRDKWEK